MTPSPLPIPPRTTPGTPGTPGTPQSPAGLLELLTQQRDLYQQLRTLSEKQAPLVEAGQPDALLALLAERQRLIDQLTVLNRQAQPLRNDPSVMKPFQVEPGKRQLEQLFNDIQAQRDAIVAQDDRDSRRLAMMRDQVLGELGQTAQTARAASAYRSGATGGSKPLTGAGGRPGPGGAYGGGVSTTLPGSARFADRQG